MKINKRKALRPVALIVAIALMQVLVPAGIARDKSSESVDAPPALTLSTVAPQEIQGLLKTEGDKPITVNGTSAKTGDTVFSGQQIQTPVGTGATIRVGQLATLELEGNSSATLTFDSSRVSVVVAGGCVELATEKGVTGTIVSGGKTKTTDPTKASTIGSCDDRGGGAMPQAGGSNGLGGLSDGWAILLAAGSVTAFAIIAHELISDSEDGEAPPPCTPQPNPLSPTLPPGSCV
jgi:hypothetical protein